MPEKPVKCIYCTKIRKLTTEEKQLYPQNVGWCEGEGGTKTQGDMNALRSCSRFECAFPDSPLDLSLTCREPVRCLDCEKLDKLAYRLATPTHHQNWLCRVDGDTKQYEDCQALRCCGHFKSNKN
jgi:hypothetical protein